MKSAFTLIEILIVVILLGILAAIVIPQFTDASDDANLAAAQTDIAHLNGQYQLWKAKNPGVAKPGNYSAAITAMTAANADGSEAVLQDEPTEPTGYTYSFSGGKFSYAGASTGT